MGRAVRQSDIDFWADSQRAHAQVAARPETDLQAQVRFPLTWYEVLTQLAEAPEKKLRLGHLSEKLQISKSNVTRLVDGIEGAGFLAREPGRQDRRVVWAVLTTAGLATITRATSTYASGIGQGQRQALPDIASWGNCWDELVTLLSKHPGATGAQELIMGLVTSLRETAGIEPDSVPAPTHHG